MNKEEILQEIWRRIDLWTELIPGTSYGSMVVQFIEDYNYRNGYIHFKKERILQVNPEDWLNEDKRYFTWGGELIPRNVVKFIADQTIPKDLDTDDLLEQYDKLN